MEITKRVLGAEHPDTLPSMINLAHTWKSQGRHQVTLALLEDCVLLRRRVLGLGHPFHFVFSRRFEPVEDGVM